MATVARTASLAEVAVDAQAAGSRRWIEWYIDLVRIPLGSLFVYAGIAKCGQAYEFLSSVYDLRLFSREHGVWVAAIVPPLEIATGLALLSQSLIMGGLLVGTVLSLLFVLIHTWSLQQGLQGGCDCFGARSLFPSRTVDWWSVAVASVQFLVSLAALLLCVHSALRSDRLASDEQPGSIAFRT